MSATPEEPWQKQPWWELSLGWRVHLNPASKHFGHCWNTRTGEQTDFTTLRLVLWGADHAALTRMVAEAIKHGKANNEPQLSS